MSQLGDLVQKVRSKNAGPFWLTIDIFCGSEAVFDWFATGSIPARSRRGSGRMRAR